MRKKYRNVLLKITILALTSFLVISCSNSAYDYEYVKMDKLSSEDYDDTVSDTSEGKQYGAVRIFSDENSSRYYVLRKRNRDIYAETLIHRGKDRNYFFSFGTSGGVDDPMIGLKIEY